MQQFRQLPNVRRNVCGRGPPSNPILSCPAHRSRGYFKALSSLRLASVLPFGVYGANIHWPKYDYLSQETWDRLIHLGLIPDRSKKRLKCFPLIADAFAPNFGFQLGRQGLHLAILKRHPRVLYLFSIFSRLALAASLPWSAALRYHLIASLNWPVFS